MIRLLRASPAVVALAMAGLAVGAFPGSPHLSRTAPAGSASSRSAEAQVAAVQPQVLAGGAGAEGSGGGSGSERLTAAIGRAAVGGGRGLAGGASPRGEALAGTVAVRTTPTQPPPSGDGPGPRCNHDCGPPRCNYDCGPPRCQHDCGQVQRSKNGCSPGLPTTDDPLSPPCVLWDGLGSGLASTQGVNTRSDSACPDCIRVVLAGADPSVDYVNGPSTAGGNPEDKPYDVDRTWRVLLRYFQTNFETFDRRVVLEAMRPNLGEAPVAFIQRVIDQQPFAVLNYGLWTNPSGGYPRDAEVAAAMQSVSPSAAYAAHGIEYFDFAEGIVWAGGANRPPITLYPDRVLDGDVSSGGMVSGGVPYLWSGQPSIEDVLDNGAAWLCESIIGNVSSPNPVASSNDPTTLKQTAHRRIALGYDKVFGATTGPTGDAPPGRSWLDDFIGRVRQQCGYQLDGPYPLEDAEDYRHRGRYDLAEASMRHIKDAHDTSVICLFCGRPQNNLFLDPVAEAEQKLGYYPEFFFDGSTIADPLSARYQGCGAAGDSRVPDPSAPPCTDPRDSFTNAVGLRELFRLPAYVQTHWFSAYTSVDPTTVVSMRTGLDTYEKLMQLFAAIQLAGPDLTPDHVARGDAGNAHGHGTYTGLYGWQRGPSASAVTTSPPAGYTPDHHAFLRGMAEVRWDGSPSAVPPGGPYADAGVIESGCYRSVDDGVWFGAPRLRGRAENTTWRLSAWTGDTTARPAGVCTGDQEAVASP